MKTLQEIIERNDYERINSALKNRAYELAVKIRTKFEQLMPVWDSRKEDYPDWAVDLSGRWYTVKYNIYRYNGVKETDSTTLCVFPNHLDDTWYSLENQPYAAYATDTPAAVFVQFLNDAKQILKQLDEKETELVNEANAALNAAKGL